MNMNDIITNGRRSGCGSCGASESNELMQLTSIQPNDGLLGSVPVKMYGEGYDIPILLQLDNVLAQAI